MELSGLIFGVIPVAAQLFQSSLSLYRVYADSQDSGKLSTKYQTLLRIQRRRYENWGEYAGLDKGVLSPQLQQSAKTMDMELVLDVLAHIATILMEAGKIEKKYKVEEKSIDPNPGTDSKADPRIFINGRQARHARLAHDLKSRLSLSSSFKFAILDKPKFEALLVDLGAFNDGLEKLTLHHQKSLETKLLVQMLDAKSSPDLTELATETVSYYPVMSEMAKRKATFLDLQTRQLAGDSRRTVSMFDADIRLKLDHSQMVLKKGKQLSGREFGTYKASPVMVEWKTLSDEMSENQSLCRIRDLAKFLSISSPTGQSPANLLPCLGYLRTPGITSRIGLVYAISPHPCTTLLSLLTDPAQEYFPLGTRFRLALSLAESLFYLHLTGWLHKALHSTNILINGPPTTPTLLQAHIGGFTAARLDGAAETSEKLIADARLDIYQHPEYQASNKEDMRYKQEYDIYSLGLLLLEIGMWTPVEVAGGYNGKRYDGRRFREKLLKRGPVESLAFSMGIRYMRAVRWCLEGIFEEDWEEKGEKDRAGVFWEKVVMEVGRGAVGE